MKGKLIVGWVKVEAAADDLRSLLLDLHNMFGSDGYLILHLNITQQTSKLSTHTENQLSVAIKGLRTFMTSTK